MKHLKFSFTGILLLAVAALAVAASFPNQKPLVFRTVNVSNYDSTSIVINAAVPTIDTTTAIDVRGIDNDALFKGANTTPQVAGYLTVQSTVALPGDSVLVAIDASPDGSTWIQNADFALMSAATGGKTAKLALVADADAAVGAAGGWYGYPWIRFRIKPGSNPSRAANPNFKAQIVTFK